MPNSPFNKQTYADAMVNGSVREGLSRPTHNEGSALDSTLGSGNTDALFQKSERLLSCITSCVRVSRRASLISAMTSTEINSVSSSQ